MAKKDISVIARIGYTFTTIFAIAFVTNMIVLVTNTDNKYNYLIQSIAWFVFGTLCFLSTKFPILKWSAPITTFIAAVFGFAADFIPAASIFLIVLTIIFLFRYQFYDKYRILKLIISAIVFAVLCFYSTVAHGNDLHESLTGFVLPLFFVAGSLSALWDIITASKRRIILSEFGLTETEIEVIWLFIDGFNTKEICDEINRKFTTTLAISTVYTIRTRAVKKLGYDNFDAFLSDRQNVEIV